jgi:broad specificity phosphatase PhoE
MILNGDNVKLAKQWFEELRAKDRQVIPDSQWPLTELGLRQASVARDLLEEYLRLSEVVPDHFVRSPYIRAVETGAVLLPNTEWRFDERFRERDWGNTAYGLRFEEYRLRHPGMVRCCDSDIHYFPGHGGETVASRLPEVGQALRDLWEVHQSKGTVVVGHGECAKIMQLVLAGGDPEVWPHICKVSKLGNLGLLHFRFKDGVWKVRKANLLNPYLNITEWKPVDPRQELVSA